MGGSIALLVAIVGIALAQLMFKIKDQTQDQISMDRCTGKYIIQLRAASIAMEKSHSRLSVYRKGVIAACIFTAGAGCAPAVKAFNAAAKIERKIQQAVQVYWNEKKGTWNTALPITCDLPIWVGRSRFPDFPFSIISESELSVADIRGLSLDAKKMFSIQLALFHPPLSSTAELQKEASRDWTIYWTQ